MWDGRGLPPVAAKRARRAAEGGAWTSLLSSASAAALRVVGFDPVGEVMGSMVGRIGWGGPGGRDRRFPTWFGPSGPGYHAYVAAMEAGYDTALSRLLAEARTIGADGVVGIALECRPHGRAAYEFTALGTAVRARSRARPERVFSTHLPGTDVAKLLTRGWVPSGLVFAVAVSVSFRTEYLGFQTGLFGLKTEVDSYTELAINVRAEARDRFARRVRDSGADGAIVDGMSLQAWKIVPENVMNEYMAEARIFGTALARFAVRGATPTGSLTYLPLTGARSGSRGHAAKPGEG